MVNILYKIQRRLKRYLYLLISIILSKVIRTKRKRVIIWSVLGKNYGCNPKYISEYINDHPELGYDVYWAFSEGCKPDDFQGRYTFIGSIKYLWVLNTAEFLITNHRTQPKLMYWYKKTDQKYIMTWHGSMPLKKIEKDALDTLSDNYQEIASLDSKLCDLMISDSKWYTSLIKSSFWYKGEILECSMPRNDIFLNELKIKRAKDKIHQTYSIPKNAKIILYAPTFRQNKNTENYISNWNPVVEALSNMYKCDFYVLIRLHPWLKGLVSYVKTEEKNIIDVTTYDDMQELLAVSDVLITDFSSTMFEFALQKKPCFLAAKDIYNYERGTYFEIKSLPFICSCNEDELCRSITSIEMENYIDRQYDFMNKAFSPVITPIGTKKIVEWMDLNSIENSL